VNGQTEFDPMKKITVICLILLFGFSAFAQKAKRIEIKKIDAYCKTFDASVKSNKSPHLIFADISQTDKPKWRKFASDTALKNFRNNVETYTISYNWQKNGKVVISNFTLFSGSGDWVQYVYHYFREDGTLAKAESELRTFHGNLIVSQDFYFNEKGKLLKGTLDYLDLETQKPTKTNDEFIDAHSDFFRQVDYYKKTDKLPFARLLIKSKK